MERELRYLGDALNQPRRPFLAVLGGAKISGKIDVIEALLPRVDQILIGGAMASTFFLPIGFGVGGSLVERDKEDLAKAIPAKAGAERILPPRAGVAPSPHRAVDRRRGVGGVPGGHAASRRGGPRGGVSRPLRFAANWKMPLGPDEARAYFKTFRTRYRPREQCEVWFFPPAVSLEAAAQAARERADLLVGAQEIGRASCRERG